MQANAGYFCLVSYSSWLGHQHMDVITNLVSLVWHEQQNQIECLSQTILYIATKLFIVWNEHQQIQGGKTGIWKTF